VFTSGCVRGIVQGDSSNSFFPSRRSTRAHRCDDARACVDIRISRAPVYQDTAEKDIIGEGQRAREIRICRAALVEHA